MKTSRRIQVVLALAVIAMLVVPWAVFATDSLDTDQVTTSNANDPLTLGNICAGQTKSGTAILHIERGNNNTNAFDNLASITVKLDTSTPLEANISAVSMTDASITLPSSWINSGAGTLSSDISGSSVTVDTTGLAVANNYSRSVKYIASGAQYGGGSLDRPGTLNITFNVVTCDKLNQTITFAPLANKTYGAADFTVSASASSGLPVRFSAAGNCTVSGNTVHITDAGSCSITASQPGNGTYNPAPDVLRTFSIAKAPLQITASSPAAGKYGDPVPTIAPIYSGFVLGENENNLLTPPTCGTTYTQGSAPNDYPTTCTGATSNNYEISYVAGNFHVAKALLTVTASSPANIYFNDPVPTITPSYSGFVLNEGPSNLTTQPTCSTNYTVGSSVGPYITSCTGGVSSNYEFKYVNGEFQVQAWTLKGFYQPVDMGILNNAKGGSTVPLKFEVFAGPTELTNTNVIKTFTQKINCDSTTGDDIEQYATGGTSLRYDTAGGQFIFNWQTLKAAGSCYRVTVTTQDGSSISADFRLK